MRIEGLGLRLWGLGLLRVEALGFRVEGHKPKSQHPSIQKPQPLHLQPQAADLEPYLSSISFGDIMVPNIE